jgi:DNA replication licensing factor MCM4
MQETPDEVPAGETPASIVLFAFDDLVDAVRPGDRVEVTGILRAQPRRVHPKISKVKSVYKTYLDVIHFRRISGTKDRGVSSSFSTVGETLGGLSKADGKDSDDDTTLIPATPSRKKKEEGVDGSRGKGITIEHIGATLSKERVALLKQMASDPDIYERLVQSLAPSIWGMDDVKKGVLCMLFGGNSKRVKKGTAQRLAKRSKTSDRSEHKSLEDESDDDTADASAQDEDAHQTKLYKRGDINILLCGDPGTSKSQLLSYVHALSPRGVYTSGKGSSAVGLTASIVRDPETRELVLESGALVLSDLGCCCIDEVNENH